MTPLLLTLTLLHSAGADTETVVKAGYPVYRHCASLMKGHSAPPNDIRVCQQGNGSYTQPDKVLKLIAEHDWFPVGSHFNIVEEVRVVCKPKGAIQDALVFPSQSEQGRRVRIEFSCRLDAKGVKKALALASEVLKIIANDRDKAVRLALKEGGVCANEQDDECGAYSTLVRNLFAGMGSELVNGRPFSVKMDDFELRAGLGNPNPYLEAELAATPEERLRALLDADESAETPEWRRKFLENYEALKKDSRRMFVELAVSEGRAAARILALELVAELEEEHQTSIFGKALSDENVLVRAMAAYQCAKTSPERFFEQISTDRETLVRERALNGVFDHFKNGDDHVVGIKFIEKFLSDSDPDIRAIAQAKLNFLKRK